MFMAKLQQQQRGQLAITIIKIQYDVFPHVLTFAIRILTFPEYVEFLKRSTVKVDSTYFLIFYPEDVLDLWLNFNEYQPMYAYKLYAYVKKSVSEGKFGDDLSGQTIFS